MTLTTQDQLPHASETAARQSSGQLGPTGFVPFPDERAAAYRAAGYWTSQPLDSVLRRAARDWPEKLAVADARDALSYADLDRLADRTAAGFAALGITPGERVLLQLPNSTRFAVTLFGLLRAGAIPVMCLPGHRLAEMTHFATVSEAVAIVIADSAGGFDYRPMAAQVAEQHPSVRHVVVDGVIDGDAAQNVTSMSDVLDGTSRPPTLAIDTSSPALLLVSGGTTGAPKLIPRTHDDYRYNFTASAELCGLTTDDVYLVALPAAHNFPLACPGLLGAMSVGATTVFTADASPEAAFATIAKHGVTATALVPVLAKLWAQACEWEPQRPTTLRLLQVGGAKLGADDARTVRAALTSGVQQVFGMAEGLLCYTRLSDPDDLVDRTQGRPLSEADELRVVDDAGDEVAEGEEGELLVRGPYTLNGYFRAERDNERSFSPDGFYRTGDKIRRFEDGYVEVTGRVKDVIHRGGETVSALDLEAHLLTHPSIWSAAAVPLPDDYLGEKICAAVVFIGKPVTLTEVNAYLDERGVATHARPDALVAMTSLPTTAVGKIDKKAIVAQLTG
ncbi:(2,3-dihydroxybenzoyl)adenylate synthase [Mycolicibacterium sp. P9-64]|uniref:(2,3-dihydroxybenzoyl)adenylate synthase n=1 Tax=Mycolicibacterium sp. P9-64 TaxID=2024612 RepID=UPI0011EEDA0D|nr:AMP-binding protein [Mycolicibacterium sp. P9-64]KAA0083479.1 (2,3-dihydroxybenzoyl)adenylate synthase [Mycolicibacterium sp. P9-64]